MTELIQGIIILLIGYLCLYALVDRICKCIETTKLTKEYNNWLKAQMRGEINEQSTKKAAGEDG